MFSDRFHFDDRRSRIRALLAVAAAVLLVAGGVVLVVALNSQQEPPQPSASAAGSVGRRTTTTRPAPSTTLPGPSTTRPAPSTTVPPSTTPRPTSSAPMQLSIPSIGVQSAVQRLGLQPNGALQVPQPGPHYDEAAWCDCSPTPGELGPSVIIGHVDSAESGPSVFYRLGALKPGATVTVTHVDGTTDTFRVDGVRRFPKDDFPTQLVYGNTPNPQLRLITCGGGFDGGSGHYVDNIVAFATLQSSTG